MILMMSGRYAMNLLLAGIVPLFVSNILLAAQAQAKDGCKEAIDFVKRDIEQRVGGKVSDISFSENQQSPFADARQEVIFALDANMDRGSPLKNYRASPSQVSANANIIGSQVLSISYARRIIDSCSRVSRVYFYLYEYNQGYSLHPDQIVRKDKCVPTGFTDSPRDVPWGQQLCI